MTEKKRGPGRPPKREFFKVKDPNVVKNQIERDLKEKKIDVIKRRIPDEFYRGLYSSLVMMNRAHLHAKSQAERMRAAKFFADLFSDKKFMEVLKNLNEEAEGKQAVWDTGKK